MSTTSFYNNESIFYSTTYIAEQSVNASDTGVLLFKYFTYILWVIVLSCNLLVVISCVFIIQSEAEPKATYMFLGNLAFSKLLQCTVVFITTVFHSVLEEYPIFKYLLGFSTTFIIECAMSVCLIAVDRYIYIKYSIHYSRWMTTTRAFRMVASTWALSILLGVITNLVGTDLDCNSIFECWRLNVTPLYVMILLGLGGTIPTVITIILNTLVGIEAFNAWKRKPLGSIDTKLNINIINEIKKQYENFNLNKNELNNYKTISEKDDNILLNSELILHVQNNVKIYTKKKTLNLNGTIKDDNENNNKICNEKPYKKFQKLLKNRSFIVVILSELSFIFAFFPYFIIILMYPFFCNDETRELSFCDDIEGSKLSNSDSIIYYLGLLNALLNPIIFIYWHKGFRRNLFKVCFKKEFRNKNRNDFVASLKKHKMEIEK